MQDIGDSFWYAIAVCAKREQCVAITLGQIGIEQFLPTYIVIKRYSDRLKRLAQPLFPGYVFAKVLANDRLHVLQVPHVLSIVGTRRGPTPIDDIEIEAVRKSVSFAPDCQPWPFLQEGQRVRIIDGPLAGVEGTLVECKGRSRLVVGIGLLQRFLSVEVDRECVQPLAGNSHLLHTSERQPRQI
ncbi:MAG: UpxY family transcription antiterminator [Bryobacterales bacterium]|nr:UpxY family transcription antiterminator [Bryobacterales bacterium]